MGSTSKVKQLKSLTKQLKRVEKTNPRMTEELKQKITILEKTKK